MCVNDFNRRHKKENCIHYLFTCFSNIYQIKIKKTITVLKWSYFWDVEGLHISIVHLLCVYPSRSNSFTIIFIFSRYTFVPYTLIEWVKHDRMVVICILIWTWIFVSFSLYSIKSWENRNRFCIMKYFGINVWVYTSLNLMGITI